MDLKIRINRIRNIQSCELSVPLEKGIFCLVGANGCGKSTVLLCLAQSVFPSSLQKNLSEFDYNNESCVEFLYDGAKTLWQAQNGSWICDNHNQTEKTILFSGMYEGSLFYGTRFHDSLIVDSLVKKSTISTNQIIDADDYVKNQMSFILHGDYTHYRTLKRVKNKHIAHSARLKNTPYFQEKNGNLMSQYKMSSGECLLVSLLHFIYNALIRKSLPVDKPILMLIDEIELALHPVAVARLIDLLNQIIKEHDTLTVILTTHSPEVIRKISPNNIYMMEVGEHGIQFYSPCYPSYAIRDIYMHSGFDYVILVEDLLAKYVVEKEIQQLSLATGKLVNVLPVGGWENVLKFQKMVCITNTFGIGTKVFSILDGDIRNENKVKKDYKQLQKMFLPINSVEKYLHKVCVDPAYKAVKRKINDNFFNVESLDAILSDYNQAGDDNGKALYRKLVDNLKKRDISEEAFVKGLCDIIMCHEDFTKFAPEITSRLSQ
jgi:hypothetical protein